MQASRPNRRAFAIAAHPDDIEFVMAGTLILLGEAGYELHYMNLANGSCGSLRHDAATTIRLRREEAMAAAEFIGATYHESLVNDIEILYTSELVARVASIVREVEPEILLVPSPQDYMEDHMNTCRLAVTAAFCRSMPNYPTLPPQSPTRQEVAVYHAQPYGNRDYLGHLVKPDFLVDISASIEKKAAMLSLHKSQRDWLDESQGVDSYVRTMRELGALAPNCPCAEGWRRHNHLGLRAPDADPLREALKGSIVDL